MESVAAAPPGASAAPYEPGLAPAAAVALPLGPWLWLALALNLVCTTGNGFEFDLSCWLDWSRALQARGFAGYPADYPPLYPLWLWVVARLHGALGLPLESGLPFKLLALAPVCAAHLVLLAALHRALIRRSASPRQWGCLMALAALNPALLFDGPLWGQIDLLFALPVALALGWLVEGRRLGLVLPLLTAALLVKLQTVAALPALAALLWVRRRGALRGLLPSLVVVGLALAPLLWAGSASTMLRAALVANPSAFPKATVNATNVWFLLGLNQASFRLYLLDPLRDARGWERLLTPQVLGPAAFLLASLWLFWDSLRRREEARSWRNALLSVLAFFLFLPAMHERYLLAAVPIALAAAARDLRFAGAALALSLASALNMAWVLAPRGGLLGEGLSLATLLVAAGLVVGGRIDWRALAAWSARRTPLFASAALLVWSGVVGAQLAARVRLEQRKVLPPGATRATTVPGRTETQGWGTLHLDQSVEGKPLTAGRTAWAFGFGTHAPSTITLPVPAGARRFRSFVALDEESRNGRAAFEVRVDGELRWRSGPLESGAAPQECEVSVQGARSLELTVDPLGSTDADHADWLEPQFSSAP